MLSLSGLDVTRIVVAPSQLVIQTSLSDLSFAESIVVHGVCDPSAVRGDLRIANVLETVEVAATQGSASPVRSTGEVVTTSSARAASSASAAEVRRMTILQEELGPVKKCGKAALNIDRALRREWASGS